MRPRWRNSVNIGSPRNWSAPELRPCRSTTSGRPLLDPAGTTSTCVSDRRMRRLCNVNRTMCAPCVEPYGAAPQAASRTAGTRASHRSRIELQATVEPWARPLTGFRKSVARSSATGPQCVSPAATRSGTSTSRRRNCRPPARSAAVSCGRIARPAARGSRRSSPWTARPAASRSGRPSSAASRSASSRVPGSVRPHRGGPVTRCARFDSSRYETTT